MAKREDFEDSKKSRFSKRKNQDSENWKTYSIDEVRMILKNNIKNHKNSNTKQGLWIMM